MKIKGTYSLLVVFLGGVMLVLFLLLNQEGAPLSATDEDYTQELQEITEIRGSFADLGEYFADLATEKGGVYAFSVLAQADLPPNMDVHLLGHIVGDELYKQQGLEGMKHCTPNFRNACSHSIVIGALLERGEGVFNDVHEVCQKAPGGSGAYTMCFHGFGHGVLAYTDYEMPEAVEMCKRVGTEAYHEREYIECVGGTIMEMTGGVHDPELREEKSVKYVPEDDPLYLCMSDLMPADAKPICYTYITPQLFTASGAGIGNPDPDRFDEAFAYCDSIPENEPQNRDACFGGFGKEFIVLVQDRDVRDFSTMTDAQFETVVDWCDRAGVEAGVQSCLVHAVNSLYWGGENPVSVPRRFCEQITDRPRQERCVGSLMQAIDYYIPQDDRTYREDFCTSLDASHQRACNDILL